MTKTAAVGYEVRWRKNSDAANKWSTPVSVGADGHVSVPGLERVTDYTFEARAISGCGAKSAWATQTFTLPDVPAGTIKLPDIQTTASAANTIANAAYAPGSNLVINPMFSLGTTGYVNFDSWVSENNTEAGWCADINLAAHSGTHIVESDYVACNPGDTFSAALDYWLFNAITSGDLSGDIRWYNSSFVAIASSGRVMNVTGSTSAWQHARLAGAVAPASTAYVTMRVFTEGASGGHVLIRRLKLEKGATCTPFNDDATQYGNLLTIGGSGQQIGDQRNLLPLGTTGVTSVLSTSPISFSISGTTVNFSVSAFSVLLGSATVAYSAASGSVTQTAGTTVTYYLYFNDPTFAGGTQTLYITTSIQTMASGNGIVNIGSAAVTVASGGGGGGGTGSGGGGWCVADDMFIAEGRRAGDAEIGDPFDCIDLPTASGKHTRALQGVTRGTEECVRMITDDGCALVCSVSTPFDLLDGRQTTAPHMLGEKVITDISTATVTSVALVGPLPVTRAHLGGVSYAAGAYPYRRIYSHNANKP